jgi:hypothetical protein
MNNAAAAGGQQSQQTNGAELLRSFISSGANGDLERAGLILGRETSELQQMINGEMEVDDDLEMKIRGISQERGLGIEG